MRSPFWSVLSHFLHITVARAAAAAAVGFLSIIFIHASVFQFARIQAARLCTRHTPQVVFVLRLCEIAPYAIPAARLIITFIQNHPRQTLKNNQSKHCRGEHSPKTSGVVGRARPTPESCELFSAQQQSAPAGTSCVITWAASRLDSFDVLAFCCSNFGVSKFFFAL